MKFAKLLGASLLVLLPFTASASTVMSYSFTATKSAVLFGVRDAIDLNGDSVVPPPDSPYSPVNSETAPSLTAIGIGESATDVITFHVEANGNILGASCAGIFKSWCWLEAGNQGSPQFSFGTAGPDGFTWLASDGGGARGAEFADNLTLLTDENDCFEDGIYSALCYNYLDEVFTLTNVQLLAPIPLPATLPLLLLGAGAFWTAARRSGQGRA